MPVPLSINGLTQEDVPRLELGISIFAFDRCLIFVGEMGLPNRIVAEPTGIADASRSYFGSVDPASRSMPSDPGAGIDDVRSRVEAYFQHVAAAYDLDSSRALISWYERYILGDRNKAYAIRDVFRSACNRTTNGATTSSPPLAADVLSRVCGIVAAHLSPGSLSRLNKDIEAARGLPKTERDEDIEQRVRFSAGGAFALSSTEMAVDFVKQIILDHATLLAWREVRHQLAVSDAIVFAGWAEGVIRATLPSDALPEQLMQWD